MNWKHRCIFWGKFLRSAERVFCLPLSVHCVDVAIVFRGLIELPGFRRMLESTAGRPLTPQDCDRLAVLALLHDAGKSNLGFQYKVFDAKAPRAGHIRELAPLFDTPELNKAFAQALDITTLETWFQPSEVVDSFLLAAWSHHGRPVQFQGEKTGNYDLAREYWWRRQDAWDPMEAVAELMASARQVFPQAFALNGEPVPSAPRFQHRFAGLVMLADWLGSHRNYFPVRRVRLPTRIDTDRETVPHMLQTVGLDVQTVRLFTSSIPAGFQERFGFLPHPLQEQIARLGPDDPEARLLIAESETGSGKTEAALYWFFTLFATGKIDGLYFALPTRVAARELYVRVRHYIERWFPEPELRPVTVLAVPGYAQVDGIPAERILPEDSTRWQDDPHERLRERVWAAEHPKRFLAATVAVGTIDQALLSVIQTAHAHLRSVCLDRSLLVVDEVHASDAYMSRLLEALLHHHLDAGGRAVLLSATLGARARSGFLGATGVPGSLPDERGAQTMPYPALTVASGKMYASAPVTGQNKRVTFSCQAAAFSIRDIVPELIRALQAGARVLAVMNTVFRANALQRAAEAAGVDPACLFTCAGVVCPHHGRFSPADRSLLDQAVSERLGKDSNPGPVLLIGTQTLEQSLDLDADLLITDLCPADVLLQRVGRLHRHVRPSRPVPYDRPRCVVLVPAGSGLEQALDAQGRVTAAYKRLGYGSVYEDLRTLELTWKVLEEQAQVEIPRDNRRLVEAVTHPECLARLDSASWAKHGQNVEGEMLAKTLAADLATAIYDQAFGDFTFNEAGARVRTRLGVDNLCLPLDRAVTSPFGMEMMEVVIPGHMAPQPLEETVAVEGIEGGTLLLRCGGRRYRYSRFGLEESDESVGR